MSEWQRGSAQTQYDFVVPANATATVVIETAAPQSLRVGGENAAHASGVLKTTVRPDVVELVVGPGGTGSPRPTQQRNSNGEEGDYVHMAEH